MATEADGFDALLNAFDRFYRTLNATTVPAEGGGRTVAGVPHAIALSEATDALYRELAATTLRMYRQHGQSVAGFPPGAVLEESDSPDGPWTPIPAGEIRMVKMGIGGNGADAVLQAALESATKVAAFPIEKWNAMQAARPGAKHQRFRAGEVVSAADLRALESAAELLRMKAPPATPTVSVSPDLLDQLQRAAAAVDPHAIDRAAERAAEKMARVFGGDTAESGSNGTPRKPAKADDCAYRPATWFPKGMAARLRMAAQKKRKTKRVATRTIDGVVCYLVADARRWWPTDVPDESK